MPSSAVLPLLARATRDRRGLTYVTPRMPGRVPGHGEQYRFHFDMRKCIGCKCCVVACNEQNGNPAAINWRRVGEIEGGFFPHATRTCLVGAEIEMARLETENTELSEQLETRKIVDRAKGILQRDLGVTEEEAYLTIQRQSRQRRKTKKEIAEAIVLADELRRRT